MRRRTKTRAIGQRQAEWLLSGGGAAFRDPAKDLPVVELPTWLNEPGNGQRSETPQAGVEPISAEGALSAIVTEGA